jgi:hypothetical protein
MRPSRKQLFGALVATGLWLAFGTVTARAHLITVIDSCGPVIFIPGDGSIQGCAGHSSLTFDQFVVPAPSGPFPFFTLYDFGNVLGGVTAIKTTGLLSTGWTITNDLTNISLNV